MSSDLVKNILWRARDISLSHTTTFITYTAAPITTIVQYSLKDIPS